MLAATSLLHPEPCTQTKVNQFSTHGEFSIPGGISHTQQFWCPARVNQHGSDHVFQLAMWKIPTKLLLTTTASHMLHILRPPTQHGIQQGAAISSNTQQHSKSHPVWGKKEKKKSPKLQSTSKQGPCSCSQGWDRAPELFMSRSSLSEWAKATVPRAFPQHHSDQLPWVLSPKGHCTAATQDKAPQTLGCSFS